MCSNKYGVAPGAAGVLLVLLLRIVSKDVYVSPICDEHYARHCEIVHARYTVVPPLPQKRTADPLMVCGLGDFIKCFRIPYRRDYATSCYGKK